MVDRRRIADGDLRAEWLKLKGTLYDPVTRLPSLPAVLDGVRRRLEAGDRIGLLYLDLSHNGHFESKYGWQAYDRLLRSIAATLRSCRGRGLSSGDTVALSGVRADEFVIFTGLEPPDADDAATARALETALQQVLAAVGRDLEALGGHDERPMPPLESACLAIDPEPMVRIERTIYQALQRAREVCRERSRARQGGQLEDLLRMLERRDIVIRYQPIVALADGVVLGFEALAGPPPTASFESPEMLFSFAEETDRILDLERLCQGEALGRAAGWSTAGARQKLFLNCSAHLFNDPALVADLRTHAAAAGVDTGDLVLEITERVAITEWRAFRRTVDAIREAGFAIAIDDMGSGYSSLHAVTEVEPDYLKFDLLLISGIDRSRIKRDLLESLVGLAAKIGARPIAEGVERLEEFDTVRAMGVTYGQGYFFAHPATPAGMGPIHFPH